MVVHVVKQALKSDANEVLVATDNQKIFDIVDKFGPLYFVFMVRTVQC